MSQLGEAGGNLRDAVQLLSDLYVSEIPLCFTKNTNEVFTKLKPNFTYIRAQARVSHYDVSDEDKKIKEDFLTGLDASLIVQRALENIEVNRPDIDDAAMAAELLIKFKDKIKRRFEVADCFQLLSGSVSVLTPTFPGSQLLKLILEFDIGDQDVKILKKREVLQLYSAFETVKDNFNSLYKTFADLSSEILGEEGAGISSTFLNYKEFDKIKIQDTNIHQALAAANKTWIDTLRKLAGVDGARGQDPPVPSPVLQVSEGPRCFEEPDGPDLAKT